MKKQAGVCMIVILASVGNVNAYNVLIDTTGPDNFNTPEFYGVDLLSGLPSDFIHSVTFDISIDGNAFFDFNGSSTYDNQHTPVIGTLVGLSPADITFDLLDPFVDNALHVRQLRFNFEPLTFGVGDSMRFAADTDFLVSDPATGDVFGLAGAQVHVTMEDGSSASATFSVISSTRSEATVVPEPATLSLLGLGSLALVVVRRRR